MPKQAKKPEVEIAPLPPREAFFTNMVEVHKDIQKVSFISDKEAKYQGKLLYKYLKLETLMHKLRPIYTKYGFSVSWNNRLEFRPESKAVVVTALCRITHKRGHSEDYSVSMQSLTSSVMHC